jgi:hypothetical protein
LLARFIERVPELCAIGAGKGDFLVVSPRQRRDDVTMADGEFAEPLRLTGRLSSGASAAKATCDEFGGGQKLRFSQRCARIGRMQVGRSTAHVIFQFHAKACSACASPALPGRGRGPRSTARSSAATAFAGSAPGAQQRMLDEREQCHRREAAERDLRRKPGEDSGRRVHERIRRRNPRPRCSSAQRRNTRRPSARSGVTKAAVFPWCTASRSATATASDSSSALAASITLIFWQALASA